MPAVNNKKKKQKVTIKNVGYIKYFEVKLFSLTKGIENGMTIWNEGKTITMTKGNFQLRFDKTIKTQKGYVPTMELTVNNNQEIANSGRDMKVM